MEEEQTIRKAPCSKCGHLVPESNMALHRANCEHSETATSTSRTENENDAQNNARVDGVMEDNGKSSTAAAVETTICEECGKEIPVMSKVIHDATCHKQTHDSLPSTQQEQQQHQMDNADDNIEDNNAVDEISETNMEAENVATATTPTTTSEEENNNDIPNLEPVEATRWACPRCTLLNPVESRQCDACLYNLPTNNESTSNPNNNSTGGATPPAPGSPGPIRVEVREVDPRVASAVTSVGNIASWSLFGALLGGPVGAVVGGGTAALFDGVNRVRSQIDPQRRQRQQQRAVFSSSSIRTTSSGTTTMSITNNVGGRLRRVNIQSDQGFPLDQLTPADQRILQMLLLHAMGSQGGDIDTMQGMTYDDLFEQFVGVPEHRRRGATRERIETIALEVVNEDSLKQLNENEIVCGICLEDFKEGDEMRVMDCSHHFHRECIDRWLGQVASCPICKKELSEESCNSSSSSLIEDENNNEELRQQQQVEGLNHDHND